MYVLSKEVRWYVHIYNYERSTCMVVSSNDRNVLHVPQPRFIAPFINNSENWQKKFNNININPKTIIVSAFSHQVVLLGEGSASFEKLFGDQRDDSLTSFEECYLL